MKTVFTISLLTISFCQEYKFEYGDEKFMDYHYNCSIVYGYTFKKRLPDGEYFAYHPNNPDLILVEANYEGRRKNGYWRTYYPHEKIQEFRQYENGRLITEKYLDSLGRTTFEINHVKQQEFGHYYSFYTNGQLKSTEEFWRYKRKSTQIITKYYPNGQIESIIRYKNRRGDTKPIGKWESYFEDGQPKSKEEYGNNWKRIGVWREWNANGEIINETDYRSK